MCYTWLQIGFRYGIWLTVLLLGTIAAVAIAWLTSGGRIYSVQTGSMQPVLHPGDAVFDRPVNFDNLRVGQIVSFRDSQQPSLITTHRVIAIDRVYDRLTTKGDHNPEADLPISSRQLIGGATMRGPKLGTVMAWLRRPLGLVLALYLPALLVVGYELKRLQRQGSVYYGR